MANCDTCNFMSCEHQGKNRQACGEHQDLLMEEYQFEAYTFDERIGSERIHTFRTEKARDDFIARQPSHRMAH